MNPRVQVEHTVTEEATGIDIVQAQLLIANGSTLGDLDLAQENINLRKHALQARITMMPGKGEVLDLYREPTGDGVRCDSAGWRTGFRPNQMYDPLVGKLICSANGVTPDSFEEARQLMMTSLENFRIDGVSNNIEAVERIISHPDFLSNKVVTSFLADNPEILDPSIKATERASGEKVYSDEMVRFELIPPMTGNVLEVRKEVGDDVDVGEVVVVLSAMKIETEIKSTVKGKVSEINCKAGDQVSSEAVLAVVQGYEEIEAGATAPAPVYTRSAAINERADPSIDVWRGSDDFVPHSINDGGMSLPIIKSLSQSQLDAGQTRLKRNLMLKKELASKLEAVKKGGGDRAVALHLKREKSLPRDRIAAIIDPGSSFLEVGALAGGNGLYSQDGIDDLKSGGVVAGIGLVHGREVMIVANDATTKGGELLV